MSWMATSVWVSGSVISKGMFMKLAHMIIRKLSNTQNMSRKTSTLQIELLGALIIQTVIPTCVSFFPVALTVTIPIFNLDLGRSINYIGVIALGAFAFCDPIAIVMCLSVFRHRVMCKKKGIVKQLMRITTFPNNSHF